MANPVISVRVATATDEASTADLWLLAHVVPNGDPIADFRRAREQPCSELLVAEDQSGNILASVMVEHDEHCGWFHHLAVRPTEHRKSIGQKIIKQAELWLASRGISRVQLLVQNMDGRIIGFYATLGFEVSSLTMMQKQITLPNINRNVDAP